MLISRTNTIVICVIVGTVGLGAFFTYRSIEHNKPLADIDAISVLGHDGVSPYTDLDGAVVDLSQYNGKVLVISAWASWCPSCSQQLTDLETLALSYEKENVAVIAINRKEPQATARAFVEHIGNPQYILFLIDTEDTFYHSIEGFAMPETVFYDADGNLVHHMRGDIKLPELRAQLELILRGSR